MSFVTLQPRALLGGIAAITALASASAFVSGNGNGGNGSGGAHGAATSGMTYHSEPVNSPWNRPIGSPMSRDDRAQPTTSTTRDQNDHQPAGIAQ